jgi:hypothetical protein
LAFFSPFPFPLLIFLFTVFFNALKPVILKYSDIPNVAVFNRPEDDSGVNIEDQIVTQGASESVSGSGSTQSSATEDQQKSGLKKTVKRKISKGKGKGEKKAKDTDFLAFFSPFPFPLLIFLFTVFFNPLFC